MPISQGTVVRMTKQPASRFDARKIAASIVRNVLPPLVVLVGLLAIWQITCSQAGSSLPPPSQVFIDSYDLIAYPFFDFGSQDIGLACGFWYRWSASPTASVSLP